MSTEKCVLAFLTNSSKNFNLSPVETCETHLGFGAEVRDWLIFYDFGGSLYRTLKF